MSTAFTERAIWITEINRRLEQHRELYAESTKRDDRLGMYAHAEMTRELNSILGWIKARDVADLPKRSKPLCEIVPHSDRIDEYIKACLQGILAGSGHMYDDQQIADRARKIARLALEGRERAEANRPDIEAVIDCEVTFSGDHLSQTCVGAPD